MENRFLVQVRNDSEYTFSLDGEWFRAGDWAQEKKTVIAPGELSVLEFSSSGIHGVSGVLWYVDTDTHDVYVSMALSNPRLETATFECYAGVPPPNLKTQLLEPQSRLVLEEPVQGQGCQWWAASLGTLSVVAVSIHKDLQHFVPPVGKGSAAEDRAASSSTPPRPSENGSVAGTSNGSDASTAAPAAAAAAAAAAAESASSAATPSASSDALAINSAEAAEAQQSFEKFMAETRPKDFGDGLCRGVKTVGTGLVAGVGTLVARTVVGAQGGVLSGIKGFGIGVTTGAGVLLAGTAAGAAQICRGAINTPEAFRGRREHKIWDQELGRWVDVDLCALEAEVEGEKSDDEEVWSGGTNAEVADMEYYDLLKVKSSATPSDIKKAYYKEARSCHPDKNPGDVEAKEKFQKLADAYQVLSNPASRQKYDREGKEGIKEGSGKLDAALFFSLLFGFERFESWVGQLDIAMRTDQLTKALERDSKPAQEEEDDADAFGQEMEANDAIKRRQHRREVRCACYLRDKLDRFVYGRDVDGFKDQLQQEAKDLASGQFGPQLLVALGEIYQLRAELYLKDEYVGRYSMRKMYTSLVHQSVTFKHKVSFYQNAAGSVLQMRKLYGKIAKEDESLDEEERQRRTVEEMYEALPQFLGTAWAAVVTDIDGTIKEVGRKLMKDKSVPWQIRVRRAEGLHCLGTIFLEEGAKALEALGPEGTMLTSEAAKERLQEALTGSVRER